jgi:hypothetical protein
MRKRLISLMLALLYLSVSIAFSGPHVHDDSQGLSHQCLACAWHFESISDAATGPILISVPVILVVPAEEPELRIVSSTPVTHSDRGPPIHS